MRGPSRLAALRSFVNSYIVDEHVYVALREIERHTAHQVRLGDREGVLEALIRAR